MPRDTAVQYYSCGTVMEDAQGKVNKETKTGCTHCGNPKGDGHYAPDCEHLSTDNRKELETIVELAAERLGNGGQGETKSSQILSTSVEEIGAANPEKPKATHVQTLCQTIIHGSGRLRRVNKGVDLELLLVVLLLLLGIIFPSVRRMRAIEACRETHLLLVCLWNPFLLWM